MRKKFCPKCGKQTDKFYVRLCKNCFLSEVSVLKNIPNKIILKKCKSCEKIFVDNKIADDVENALDLFLMEILKQPEIYSATYRVEGNKVHVNLKLKLDDLEKTEEKISELIVKKITCKSCSMKSVGYYQSILQIRAPQIQIDEILEEVENQINLLNKYDNLAFISKIDKKTEGIDVYIGSKSVAMQIAKNLKNRFSANIKISRKLSGSISGKKVYRDTILVSVGE